MAHRTQAPKQHAAFCSYVDVAEKWSVESICRQNAPYVYFNESNIHQAAPSSYQYSTVFYKHS